MSEGLTTKIPWHYPIQYTVRVFQKDSYSNLPFNRLNMRNMF